MTLKIIASQCTVARPARPSSQRRKYEKGETFVIDPKKCKPNGIGHFDSRNAQLFVRSYDTCVIDHAFPRFQAAE